MKKLLPSLVLSILCINLAAQNFSFTRKPYLNKATQSGVNIMFRTNEPCNGWVNIIANDSTEFFIQEESTDTNHNLLFDQGTAFSKYQYGCGCNDDTLIFPSAKNSFKTLPEDDYTGPINIWAIGDFGNGGQGQIDTYTSYLNYADSLNIETDVWLMLGDNAYGDGTDAEYQAHNFNIYEELLQKTVVWPVPGNHDYKSVDIITHNGPYYDIYDLPTQGESGGLASNTEKYYSYDVGNVHFVCLNSEWSPWIYVPVASEMALWLTADLQATDKKFKVVYFHQPPYSKGSHDSDDPFGIMNMFRQNIIPLVELGGADLVISGHSHCYERSYLINGHYGYSSFYNETLHLIQGGSGNLSLGEEYYKKDNGVGVRGTIYNVVGNSGALSESGTLDHPVMYYSDNVIHGSSVIRVHGDTLTSRFLSSKGEILDEYTLIKNAEGAPGEVTSTHEKEEIVQTSLIYHKEFNQNWLRFECNTTQSASLSVYNTQGKKVKSIFNDRAFNKGMRKYPLEDLPAGVYVGELILDGKKHTVKFQL